MQKNKYTSSHIADDRLAGQIYDELFRSLHPNLVGIQPESTSKLNKNLLSVEKHYEFDCYR